MQIPNQIGQIRQIGLGDYAGELWETFGIDLSSIPGKIKTSKRLERILTASNLGSPAAIVDLLIWDSRYIVCTEDSMFTCPVSQDPLVPANWGDDAVSSDLDLSSTAIVFNDGTNNRLRIALDTNIAEWNGGATYDPTWWTGDKAGTALIAGVPHVLEVVQSQKETLYVTDGSRVQYYEKGAASTQIVELDGNVIASCLAAGLSGAMWVGTYNETSGNAYVYEIYTNEQVDGTTVYRQAYPVDGRAVLAIWVSDNTPYIVTERGIVYRFNGAGFSQFAQFPFQLSGRHLDDVRAGLIQDSNTSRPIHPRGVKTRGQYTYILINADSEEDAYAVTTNTHSGIWELDNLTGSLTHKYAFVDSATDKGIDVLARSGPLLLVDNEYTFLMAGCETPNGVGLYGVKNEFGLSYFVTPEELSQVETDSFLRAIHKASLRDTAELYTLYRYTKRPTVYGQIFWLDSTSFTTLTDWSSVQEGELVRISHGYAAGDWAIVTNIDSSATTYTVTVSRPIGLTEESSFAYSDNFLLAQDTYLPENGESKRIGFDQVASWFQIMVIMHGDIEYRMFDLVTNAKSQRK